MKYKILFCFFLLVKFGLKVQLTYNTHTKNLLRLWLAYYKNIKSNFHATTYVYLLTLHSKNWSHSEKVKLFWHQSLHCKHFRFIDVTQTFIDVTQNHKSRSSVYFDQCRLMLINPWLRSINLDEPIMFTVYCFGKKNCQGYHPGFCTASWSDSLSLIVRLLYELYK